MANKITSKELMAQKKDFVIIDVREIDELESGIIEDSIQPSTEYANSQIPPLKRSNIDLKIIETLGSSEIIINTHK